MWDDHVEECKFGIRASRRGVFERGGLKGRFVSAVSIKCFVCK